MKSITIHDLDDNLARMIRQKAKEEGLSLNKTLKALLEIALGVRPQPAQLHRKDFAEFCGAWSKQDLKAFEQASDDLRKIDKKDWS